MAKKQLCVHTVAVYSTSGPVSQAELLCVWRWGGNKAALLHVTDAERYVWNKLFHVAMLSVLL